MSRPGQELRSLAIFATMYSVGGFATWLNGPLITFVKVAFRMGDIQAFLVPMSFYMSYLFLALPAGAVLRRTGLKRGMALALLVMAGGSAGFGYFAMRLSFVPALVGLFAIGGGLTMLMTAGNPYIAIVGRPDRAAQRIALMGVCNKLAGILAPLVFGALVLRGIDTFAGRLGAAPNAAARQVLLAGFAAKVLLPYLLMAALLAVLALFVWRSSLPDIRIDHHTAPAARGDDGSIFRQRFLWLGVLCVFLYVGAEVMATDVIGPYGQAFGLPLNATAYFTSLTMTAMLVGYGVGACVVPRFLSQQTYLVLSAGLALVLVLVAAVTHGYASVASVALLGFANAMMWPAIIPLVLQGLGRHTETGSALIVMSLCGGAIIPQMFALMKTVLPFQTLFAVMMGGSYLYIMGFGILARRTQSRRGRGQPA